MSDCVLRGRVVLADSVIDDGVIEVRDGVGIGVGADLSPLELDRIMRTPADEVYRTEDTQQIVVRTTASTPR